MHWYRSLTTQQRTILIALAVSVVLVMGLLAWNVRSTMQRGMAISPLPSPLTPSAETSATAAPSPSPEPTSTPPPTPSFDISEAGRVASEVADARQARTRWGTPLTIVDDHELAVAIYDWYQTWPPLVMRARAPLEVLGIWYWHELVPDAVSQADHTAALYAPQLEELYLRDDWNGSQEILVTQLAYGYARALPDQYGDLVTLMEEAPSLDRQLALAAVAEGDAMVSVWRYQGVDPRDQEAAVIRDWVAQAVCPYWRIVDPLLEDLSCLALEMGSSFATAHVREEGVEKLDAIILRPPRSTEQVLHPERYLEGDEPQVLLPAEPELGRGWVLTQTETMGEAFMGLILVEWSNGLLERQASVNWGGDLLQVWTGPEAQEVVLWQTVWDNSRAAGRFYGDVRELMPDPLLRGRVLDTTAPASLPRGRWWAGDEGAVFLRRRADRVFLVWGTDLEAVERVGQLLP